MKVWIVYKAWSNDIESSPIEVKGFTSLAKAKLFAEELQKQLDKNKKKNPYDCDVCWASNFPVEVEE